MKEEGTTSERPPWPMPWLTAAWCRAILAALILIGFAGHWLYLTRDCPIDLAGDEAHYWDWSRQLDVAYYSKGPLVAWIIRASCWLAGQETMPVVRLPALVLAALTTLLTYGLTARLFASERVALGAVLLNHLVPMFIAGSALMTIDPPYYLCWGLATACAARAVLRDRPRAWLAAGLFVGLGALAKYGILMWLACAAAIFLFDRPARRHLRTPWPWLGLALALAFLAPAVIWNARHDWVTYRHVSTSMGARAGDDGADADANDKDPAFRPLGPLDLLGGQLGALGPPLAVILAGAVVYAASKRFSGTDPRRREMRLLLCASLPFLAAIAAKSLTSKIQVNWPAPAYFALIILAAHFLSTRLADAACWKPWRGWVCAAAILGLVAIPLLHDTSVLYRPVAAVGAKVGLASQTARPRWDPTRKLRGWRELGAHVSAVLRDMPPDTMVMAERYDLASLLAFYVEHRPRTFAAGSWYADPRRRTRMSQFDLWPDRSLDLRENPALRGRSALFVGNASVEDLRRAFDRVEEAPRCTILREGLEVRTFRVWRCHGFKGMPRPSTGRTY